MRTTSADAAAARDGVRLAHIDFGGDGPPVVLLHGLAGHAGEWAETASWLRGPSRMLAPDARGHGRSERAPSDVSRAAHVADVAWLIRRLGLSPVVLVGQSLGGLTALLVAARHPELVRGLVVADASPAGGDEDEPGEVMRFAAEVGASLGRWPVPFPSREAAVKFFDGPSLSAEAWTDGLERRDDGWYPQFEVGVLVRTLREALERAYWPEWERIRCPTLVMRAGRGVIPAHGVQRWSTGSPTRGSWTFPRPSTTSISTARPSGARRSAASSMGSSSVAGPCSCGPCS